MWRLFLLGSILLVGSTASADCTSASSGAWAQASTWAASPVCGTAGIPTAADAVIIAASHNITCSVACDFLTLTMNGTVASPSFLSVQATGVLTNHCTAAPCVTLTAGLSTLEIQSGATANLGSNTATTATLDIVVNSGGNFLLDNGGTLNLTGTINFVPSNATLAKVALNGHTICNPNGTAVAQYLRFSGSGAAYNSQEVDFVGASWASPAVFETRAGQAAGGACYAFYALAYQAKLVINYAIFNNCGDTSNYCINAAAPGLLSNNLHDISVSNVLLNNSGQMYIKTNNGTVAGNSATFSMDRVSIRNQNAASATPVQIAVTNTTAPTTSRNITNIDCANDNVNPTNQPIFTIAAPYVNVGSSTLYPSSQATDIVGMNLYNCSLLTTGLNITEENFFIVNITTTALGGSVVANLVASTNYYQNSVNLTHGANPHFHNQSGTGGTGADNYFQYNFYDGNNYMPGDSGEMCHDAGTLHCIHNIDIDADGNLENTQANQSMIIDNNTLFNQTGISAGETAGSATELQEVYDNVFDHPVYLISSGSQCYTYENAVHRQTQFASQTNFRDDNNAYYGMPNTSDFNSRQCPTQPGSIAPYYTFIDQGFSYRNALGTKVSTTGTGTVNAGGIELDYATGGFTGGTGDNLVQVNDVVSYGASNPGTGWATVKAINSNTQLILNNPATLGPNGSGPVTIASGNQFSLQKNPWSPAVVMGSATDRGLHDFHASPSFVNAGDDICHWYNDTFAAGLTCNTGVIIAATGSFTMPQTIGRALVTLNGWDYGSGTSLAGTNCTASCPQRVTPQIMMATPVLKRMWQSYRPMSGMLHNAGHCSTAAASACNVGATDVFNPAIMQ